MNDISALLSGAFHIELEFTCESDPNANLRVTDATVSEALSETYRAEISLMTEDAIEPPAMLGRNATFLVRRGGSERKLHGIVTRVEQGGVASVGTSSAMVLRVTVEPALCALKHTRDSRIFQNQKIVDIVNEVLGKELKPYGRSLEAKNLKSDYPEREYTVQYEESDYDFISRLLAQEGISYFFDHADKVEKLVLADDKADFITFESVDGNPVPMTKRADENPDTEPVLSFVRADRIGTTSVVVRDYDWTHPEPPGPKAELLQPDAQTRERIAYASTGETNIGKYVVGQKAYTEHDIGARATRLHERMVSHAQAFTGEGAVTGFMPGVAFELTDHALPDLDGKYLVTSVVHAAGSGAAAEGENADRYRNYFTAIPFDVPYRPPAVTPWPRIHGVQTATVVGPAGAEMHTDEHARICVQFHWDRQGKRDDHSSVFIRCAQVTAGPSYGFVFIPRIGMEVLVTFIDGNPDRPLVTGCVYNGKNNPFHELPAKDTRSVIRTRTFGTDAASGTKYNELSFNDAPGAEEIFTHASKDYNEVVEADHNTTVGGNHTNTVGVNDTESVGGDQSLSVTGSRTKTITVDETTTVTGNRTETVTGAETITITGGRTETVTGNETISITTNRTETVAANESITIGAGRSVQISVTDDLKVGAAQTIEVGGLQAINVGALRTVAVGGAQKHEIGAADSLDVSGPQSISVGGNRSAKVGGADTLSIGKKLLIDAADEITLKTGDASITMKKNGDIAIKGKNITVTGSAKITIKASSDIVIKGSKVGTN